MKENIKLNLGCGSDIKKDYINVDILKKQGINLMFDLDKFYYPIKAHSCYEIYMDNVLEHVDDVVKCLNELWRICKNNAVIIIKVPYYNSYGAFNDITHKHYFNANSFQPFYTKTHRSDYQNNNFELIKMDLIPTRLGKIIPFKSIRLIMSYVFGQLFALIIIKLRVIKNSDVNDKQKKYPK